MSFFDFPHTRTYDSDLGWIIKTIKKVTEEVDALDDWKISHEAEYEQLKTLYDQVMSGNFPPEITAAFSNWMMANGLDLVGELVKMVFFGITDTGHFVAYIPEYWSDIIFNTTGYDISIVGYDFGHLTLSFEIGG